jgi:threonine dehydratase
LEIEKTVVEGSGATAIAAIASKKLNLSGNVAAVLTGGNIDMTVVGRIIERGLAKDGRLTRLRVVVDDIPGELAKLAQFIGSTRANIRDIVHERTFHPESFGTTQNIFTLETRGPENVKQIQGLLTEKGYKYYMD